MPPAIVDNGFFDELVAELSDGAMPTVTARQVQLTGDEMVKKRLVDVP